VQGVLQNHRSARRNGGIPLNEITSPSTRRALLGLGGTAALAFIAGQTLASDAARADNETPAPTDSPTPSSTPSASGAPPTATPQPTKTPTTTPSKPRRSGKPRAVALKPFAAGGPASIDESTASAILTSADSVPIGSQYPTYGEAAAAAQPIASSLFDGTDASGHLLRRATFGFRSGDVRDLKKYGIDGWLTRQFSPSKIDDPEGSAAWSAYSLAGASPKTIVTKVDDFGWDAMLHTTYATLARQIFSKRQLFEITVDIFANHLHVPLPGEQWATSPGYLKNVIRAHAFGKYSDMLLAAMKHPAMLNFLSNDESRKEHVNENLGRELLELHTVGIAGGYTEADVKASAKILSGRTWQDDLWSHRSTYGNYRYHPEYHYVGPVSVLGFSHLNSTASGGEAVGDAYVKYLAHHPMTAAKIARKIATRFVSDKPSDDLVSRLADVYLAKDTDIREVVKAVFRSSDFWSATGTRMRRPLEDAVGAARVLNVTRGKKMKSGIVDMFWTLDDSGHTPHGWLPPNGYPDVAAAWLGAGAMIQRWNLHRGLIWWGFNFGFTKAKDLYTRTSTMTSEAWVRGVAKKLLGTQMSDAHVAAVLAGSDLVGTELINSNWWKCGRAAALILDSPYFQLR
jgi:uncharacterized protein (DUF1800 family)